MPSSDEPGRRPVALIAGGGGEIGRAVGEALATTHVVAALDHDAAAADETAVAVAAAGGRCVAIRGDVTVPADVDRAVELASAHGGIELVVHAAGVLRTARLLKLSEEEWDDVFDVNAKGRYLVSRAVAEHMLSHRRGGVIVDVGSITAERVTVGRLHYCVANACSAALMQSLAEELHPEIRVINIASGPVATKMIGYRATEPERLERFLQHIPLRRLGEPRDIASVIAYLASPDAAHITGTTLHLDGGWTAA